MKRKRQGKTAIIERSASQKEEKALTELHIFSQSHDEQFMVGLFAFSNAVLMLKMALNNLDDLQH